MNIYMEVSIVIMNMYIEKSCSECLFNGRLFMQLENAIFIFLSKQLYHICTFLAERKQGI